MKTWGVEVYLDHSWPRYLLEVSGHLNPPNALPPKKSPGTHLIGGLMGPKSCLDTVEKIKFFVPSGIWTPAVQPIARCYTNWAIPVPITPLYVRFFIIIRKRTFLCSNTLQGIQNITAHVSMTISKLFYSLVRPTRVLVSCNCNISNYLPRTIVIGAYT
jgi:hypothetical protein